MNCHISFISWFSRHIHNMKIINKMDNKFFGLKKKLISISLIAYVFTKVFMFIVHSICSALSCRLSAQFFPQLPHGCFACCCLNMSFIHIPLLRPKTLHAVCADLVNHEYQGTFQLISGAAFFKCRVISWSRSSC